MDGDMIEDAMGGDDMRRMLRDSAVAFVARECDLDRVRASRAQAPGFARDVWTRMAENGWFGLLVPEAKGGVGLGQGEAIIVAEALGGALAPEPFTSAIVLAVGALRGCDIAFGEALLSRMIAGEAIPALAWQEARNVYDPAAITTRAEPSGEEFALTGRKILIPAAAGADGFVVSANGPDGPALYWVAAAAEGLALTLDAGIDGVAIGTITLDGAMGHAVVRGDAAAAVARAVDEARLCASAELVGVMSRALDITLEYVKQREQFGRPIGKFQALQHRLVDLWTQRELSRNTLAQAARVFDETDDPARRAAAVSAAKARCSEAALLVGRESVQLHGAIGYTDECAIGLFLKRALALSAWLGNAAVHRARFAQVAPDRAA